MAPGIDSSSDVELLHLTATGDERALRVLFERHGTWLVDFWETRQGFDAFSVRIGEGMAAAGVQPQGPPEIEEFPVHEMIRG